MRSAQLAAVALASLIAMTCIGANAKQLPQRSELDDAACDPKLGPRLAPRLFSVVVNDTDVQLETIFLQRPCGAVLVRQKDLEAVRIKTAGKPRVEINGEKYLDLNAYEGLTFKLDAEQQRIVIEGESRIFHPTVLNFENDRNQRAQAPPPGGFINYGLFSSGPTRGGNPTYSGSATLGLFGDPGVLTSDWLYTHTVLFQSTYRLATTFTHDDEARVATLRIGDVFGRAGAFGGGASMAGVQYGTNFALRPGMITSPVQMMEAATTRNANVDLQAYDPNDPDRTARAAFFNALTTAPYGPVEMINIPTYDNGEYHMILRDRLGREVSVSQEFYFNQGLLRKDLTDYSVEAGVRRMGAVGDHYHGGFVSGTRRHGETQAFTDEFHAEATGSGYAAGATGLLSVPHWGVVNLTAAGSHTDLAGGTGLFLAGGLENRYRNYAYATRVECRDARFHLPTEVAPVNPNVCREFASLSGKLPWQDTASVSVSNADLRTGPDVQSVLLSYSRQVLPGSQLQLFAGWTDSGAVTYSGGLTFTLAFGAAHVPMPFFEPARTHFTMTANTDSQSKKATAFGRISTGTGNSDNAYGFQAGAALDGRDQQSVSGSWSGSRAVAVASLFQNDNDTTYSAGGSSALAFMDGGVFASRPLYSSFALVRLGEDYGGVRVNDFHTNGDGDLLVSPLQPYYENQINLNAADLPVNARVEELQYQVRPRFRSGVVLKPSIRPARDALLTVEVADTDGKRVPLPLGAYAVVPGTADPFPVGEDGLIYVSGLEKGGTVTIHYRDQECQLQLELPAKIAANSTPELGTFLCEGVRP